MLSISAVIPYKNNQASVGRTIDSLRQQTYPLFEILLINDGSEFLPSWLIQQEDIRIVSFTTTRGRGAVRAFAIEHVQSELILFCDASIMLPLTFAAKAVEWLDYPHVAAAFGRIRQERTRTASDRWRARHLFKEKASVGLTHNALLATYGCLIRRKAALESGNFNPLLIHSEDVDLGMRLLGSGLDVIFDPDLYAICSVSNTIPHVLERYWRWHAGPGEAISFKAYLKQIYFSLKVMALEDLADFDLSSLFITLVSPHYQFFKSLRQDKSSLSSIR